MLSYEHGKNNSRKKEADHVFQDTKKGLET